MTHEPIIVLRDEPEEQTHDDGPLIIIRQLAVALWSAREHLNALIEAKLAGPIDVRGSDRTTWEDVDANLFGWLYMANVICDELECDFSRFILGELYRHGLTDSPAGLICAAREDGFTGDLRKVAQA
jgi:hypothetical protein